MAFLIAFAIVNLIISLWLEKYQKKVATIFHAVFFIIVSAFMSLVYLGTHPGLTVSKMLDILLSSQDAKFLYTAFLESSMQTLATVTMLETVLIVQIAVVSLVFTLKAICYFEGKQERRPESVPPYPQRVSFGYDTGSFSENIIKMFCRLQC